MAAEEEVLDDVEPRKGRPWLLPVVALVGALAGGAGGFFAGRSASAGNGGEQAAAASGDGAVQGDAQAEEQEVAAADDDTEITPIGTFTVNLRDGAGARLLQMDLSVEVERGVGAKVQEREPQLRDAIILLASDYSAAELEGMEGKLRFRDDIQRRIDAILAPDRVVRVYFTQFVVQ